MLVKVKLSGNIKAPPGRSEAGITRNFNKLNKWEDAELIEEYNNTVDDPFSREESEPILVGIMRELQNRGLKLISHNNETIFSPGVIPLQLANTESTRSIEEMLCDDPFED